MECEKESAILDCIGSTPLIKLKKVVSEKNASIYAKVEISNPGGSIKDRFALSAILSARKRGLLKPGSVIIEPTSGNTGISLAMVGAAMGYRVILVMPAGSSEESKRALLSAYGAEVITTDKELGMLGSLKKAEELLKKNQGFYMPCQFENPSNPEVHRKVTAREILRQMGGKRIDVFIAGVGTGGTITGVGEVLRTKFPDVRIVAVEPSGSPVLSGGKPGPHHIPGIGAGFVPDILNREILSSIHCVSDEEARLNALLLAGKEGILAGPSSGAALSSALSIAKTMGPEKNIVTLFPDTGERHLCNY